MQAPSLEQESPWAFQRDCQAVSSAEVWMGSWRYGADRWEPRAGLRRALQGTARTPALLGEGRLLQNEGLRKNGPSRVSPHTAARAVRWVWEGWEGSLRGTGHPQRVQEQE